MMYLFIASRVFLVFLRIALRIQFFDDTCHVICQVTAEYRIGRCHVIFQNFLICENL